MAAEVRAQTEITAPLASEAPRTRAGLTGDDLIAAYRAFSVSQARTLDEALEKVRVAHGRVRVFWWAERNGWVLEDALSQMHFLEEALAHMLPSYIKMEAEEPGTIAFLLSRDEGATRRALARVAERNKQRLREADAARRSIAAGFAEEPSRAEAAKLRGGSKRQKSSALDWFSAADLGSLPDDVEI